MSYKNFLSTGNKPTVVDFLKGSKKIFVGKNSSGKSIISDALCFAIYNKAFRKIKKNNMINSVNQKNLVVELEFSIGVKDYKIIRGISPTICELYIDGKLKRMESSARDYQSYIENSVLRMTEKTFRQIVVLGSSDYVPFMKCSQGVKRSVIEDLLEISIFSNMNEVVKKRANGELTALNSLLTEIKLVENNIKTYESNLEKIEEKESGNLDAVNTKIEEIKKEIAEENDKLKSLVDEMVKINIDEMNDKLKIKKKELKRVESIQSKIDNNKTRANKMITFLNENSQCHSCEQDIPEEHKKKAINLQNGQIKDYESALTELDSIIDKNQDELKILSGGISDVTSKGHDITLLRADITNLETRLVDMKAALNNSSDDEFKRSLVNDIALYKDQLEELIFDKEEIMKNGNALSYLSDILKDDGIKSKIIKTYLPVINKLIRKYLDILNFDIDFRFNEAFEETIKARFKDNFSYYSFSTGQQLRINLALLFTWRELSKMKNSTATNLIILDEVHSSSLDQEGTDAFNAIINDCISDKQCAVIISHDPASVISDGAELHTFSLINHFTHETVQIV